MGTTEIVSIITGVGIWIYVFWIGKSVKNLKDTTEGLSNVFESMKTHAEYMQSIHNTAKSLYDPEEIKKLVTVKAELARVEASQEIETLKQEYTQIIGELEAGKANAEQTVVKLQDAQQEVIEDILTVHGIYTALTIWELDRNTIHKILEGVSTMKSPRVDAFARMVLEILEVKENEMKIQSEGQQNTTKKLTAKFA